MGDQSKKAVKAFENAQSYLDNRVRLKGFSTKLEGFVREIERRDGQTYFYIKLLGMNKLVPVRKDGVELIKN